MLDISKLKKNGKEAVSVSLDKENLRVLREHLEKKFKNVTLSAIFDSMLKDLVMDIKTRKEEKTEKKEEIGNAEI